MKRNHWHLPEAVQVTHELIGKRRDARHNISINACMPFFLEFRIHMCSLHSEKKANMLKFKIQQMYNAIEDYSREVHITSYMS